MMKTEALTLTREWDKTFPKSDRVDIIPFDKLEKFFKEYLK